MRPLHAPHTRRDSITPRQSAPTHREPAAERPPVARPLPPREETQEAPGTAATPPENSLVGAVALLALLMRRP